MQEKNIIVNQHACQAIASSFSSLRNQGWRVLKAYDPLAQSVNAPRTLHAKFIFAAQKRKHDDLCKIPWVYLDQVT